MGVTEIKHLTVVVDGSAASDAAVRHACELARNGASLSFCHFPAGTLVHAGDGVMEKAEREICEAAVRQAQSLGIQADRFGSKGKAAEAIVACAREHGSEVIVVGNGVRNGAARSLGSATKSLMHIADRPVVVVHEDDVPRDGPIAVAIGAHDRSFIVLDTALAIATAHARDVFLMYDITLPENADYYAAEANTASRLTEATERAQAAGIKTSSTVGDGVGPVADMLISAAEQHGCSMIVTGLHDHSGIVRLFVGSIAEDIVRDASVPVAVVHHTH